MDALTGSELAQLVDQRLNVLETLVDLTRRQAEAIERGHMSELLAVLSAKQAPIQKLSVLSTRLTVAIDQDPETRTWSSPEARTECRQRHNHCEDLLKKLIEDEKSCEGKLSSQHHSLQQDLDRAQGTGRAIASYASVAAGFQASQQAPHATHHGDGGDHLDLSNL